MPPRNTRKTRRWLGRALRRTFPAFGGGGVVTRDCRFGNFEGPVHSTNHAIEEGTMPPEWLQETDRRRDLAEQHTPVRVAAIVIREAVVARQFPRAEDVPRALEDVRVGGERSHCPANKQRRFGFEELRVLLAGVAPVGLRDAEVLSIDSDRRKPGVMDTAATRCVRSSPAIRAAKPLSGLFTTSAIALPPPPNTVSPSVTSTMRPRRRFHVGRRMLGGDEVREDRLAKGVGAVGEIGLPEAAHAPSGDPRRRCC